MDVNRNLGGIGIPTIDKAKLDFSSDAEDFKWAVGIEDTFIPQTHRTGERRLDEFELTQHYQFWKEDLDLASELGVNMTRYGIPWYKVNPSPGKYDWTWIDRVIDYLVNKTEIDPIADLNHYVTPTWMDNEFANAHYPERMAEYAREFARRYGDVINYYAPHNEPLVNATLCGEIGTWPPHLHGYDGFVKIFKNICKGIILTMNAVREEDPNATFVHVEATGLYHTKERKLQKDVEFRENRLRLMYDLISGLVDEGHPLHGWLLQNGMKKEELRWFQDNSVRLGIIGLNYYPQGWPCEVCTENGKLKEEMTGKGGGLLKGILKSYFERYRRPILITETCVYGNDEEKAAWLKTSIAQVKECREEGMPVIGYTWWPLFDCIGWDYRSGGRPVEEYIGYWNNLGLSPVRKRGGLWRLEMQFDYTLKRVKTKFADQYRSYIANSKEVVGKIASAPRRPR